MAVSKHRRKGQSRPRQRTSHAWEVPGLPGLPDNLDLDDEVEGVPLKTVWMLGLMADEANPPCPGVIVVHLPNDEPGDVGAIGCVTCDSVSEHYHAPTQIAPCDRVSPEQRHPGFRCLRCTPAGAGG